MLLEICLLTLLVPPDRQSIAAYLDRSAMERKTETEQTRRELEAIRAKIRGGFAVNFRTVELSDAYFAPLKAAQAKAEARLKWLEDDSRPYYAALDLARPAETLGRIDGELKVVEVVNRELVIASVLVADPSDEAPGEREILVALPLRTFGRRRGETFFAGETVWHYVRTERTRQGDVRHFEPVSPRLLEEASE